MQELYISNNQNMNSSEPEYYAGDGLLPHEPLQQHVLRSGEILHENCVQNITKLNISHLTNCFLYRSSLGAGDAIQSLLLGLVGQGKTRHPASITIFFKEKLFNFPASSYLS